MTVLRRYLSYLLSISCLLLPITAFAGGSPDPQTRGFGGKDWQPRGQLRQQEHGVRSKLRELRLQETRRPRDIQAAPNQNLGAPWSSRPESFMTMNKGRERTEAYLAGPDVSHETSFQSFTFGTLTHEDKVDNRTSTIDKEEPPTEWWEMNERSRSQRGGWFRTRFGSKQPQMQQQQQQGGQGQGTIGPPGGIGGSGGGGGEIIPGQNMPEGGGMAPTGIEHRH